MDSTKGTITKHHRRISSSGTACRHHNLTFLLLAIVTLFYAMAFHGADASVVYTYQRGQKMTSSTLRWEQYSAKDLNQMEYAVQGGKFFSPEEHYPIYVCRVVIEGVQTSGHTEKQKQSQLCVVSYMKDAKKYDKFEVLINKGNLGKIMWKQRTKFNAGIPIGAVSVDDYSYIARRNQSNNEHNNGADYYLGRLDPTLKFGKILILEDQNEKEHDDGEVLIETEPIRYELRKIVLDNIRSDEQINITELEHKTLENIYDTSSRIESTLSYSFNVDQYWGTHEGIARGLDTQVYEEGATIPAKIKWGLNTRENKTGTKTVSAKLQPGTAINVTLMGLYATLEAPYRAKLFAFFQGTTESVSRDIKAEVRKRYLKDIRIDFSPAYWIENGTFIPTTTTTTTTSTTTHPSTTKQNDAKPMSEPPIILLSDVGRLGVSTSDSQSPKTKSDSNGGDDINQNIIPNESRENYAEDDSANTGTSHSTRLYCWTNSILILFILVTVRVFG